MYAAAAMDVAARSSAGMSVFMLRVWFVGRVIENRTQIFPVKGGGPISYDCRLDDDPMLGIKDHLNHASTVNVATGGSFNITEKT